VISGVSRVIVPKADTAIVSEITRRSVLRVLGGTAAIGLAGETAARGNGRINRVLSTGSPVPENIAFADNGDLYIGITGGSVRRLPADRTDETDLDLSATAEAATYPGGVAGVLVAGGRLYTAVNGDSGSVYEFKFGSDSEPTELATLLPDGNGFVNDLYADGDRLLVTESFGGTVYEVPLGTGDPAVWVQDGLLDTESFGANGITRIDDDVYVNGTCLA
jgi:hypothetical protein